MSLNEVKLQRTKSMSGSRKIIPSTSMRATNPETLSSSSSFSTVDSITPEDRPLVRSKFSVISLSKKPTKSVSLTAILRSILGLLPLPLISIPTCRWLSIPSSSPHLGRRVTGTLFGQKKGHVSFAVQEEPRSEPVLLLELATPTCSLVKEMSSGLVRIALECERGASGRGVKLFHEPIWTMYCNGRKTGYAVSRTCSESDWHVLRTVQTVSIGAGVLPPEKAGAEGELMYMRAKFERVVGSRDSEAFYMMNPDGNGGPELSIFLLRI
ncbi:protein MIZU-KUSSEI 1 [Magnolia sinica]|uniref:protein MIZU-KUSSEI 1 n=1 Tax=Magnolia sinica TaxID=86752 RepID=UPI0026584225|nr:protein MIZU-KUSSEI 1 [Magnolia sinica]